MLLRILGEVVVGFMAAGVVMAVAIPAIAQFGYQTGPWMAWAALALCIVGCVVAGERRNLRQKARKSP